MTDISMQKQRCFNCIRRTTLTMKCKFCDENYCVSCIQQEVHVCKKIDRLIEKLSTELENKLCSEKCIKRKIEEI